MGFLLITCSIDVTNYDNVNLRVKLKVNFRNLVVKVSRMDRVRNEEVRRRAGIESELASRADQRVLRWFGHMERMDD